MSKTKEGEATAGDNSTTYNLAINVFAEDRVSLSALDSAFQGVVDACDEAYTNTDIPGYEVVKYDTDHNLDCSNKTDSGADWLNNNGFYGADAACLWVNECEDAVAYSNSWQHRTQAFVSTSWYGTGHYLSVMAIHEAFHTYILDSCAHVDAMLGSNGDEHSLGHDIDVSYYGTSFAATPMTASYNDDSENYESKGDCNNDETTSDVTRNLSTCAVDALEYSYYHAKGHHTYE